VDQQEVSFRRYRAQEASLRIGQAQEASLRIGQAQEALLRIGRAPEASLAWELVELAEEQEGSSRRVRRERWPLDRHHNYRRLHVHSSLQDL